MKSLFIIASVFFSVQIIGQGTDIELYSFGHSLIDHRPPAIPTPSDETTVLHWIHDISTQSENTFGGGGQYGFLTSHDNLPPISQWFYDEVPLVWNDEEQTFGETNINTILITAANFIQNEYSPTGPHPLDASTTAVQATSDIFNWVADQGNDCRYYIYANWPEMDLVESFPPTIPADSEIEAYHTTTIGPFMDWWIEFQDEMILSDPELDTKMIPTGAIISKFITGPLGQNIPFDEIYEDSAPHGRANLYFLAGMITYMAFYEEQIPDGYDPGNIIHDEIRNQLAAISDFMWDELMAFNFSDGSSRVFANPVFTKANASVDYLKIWPNPSSDIITLMGMEINEELEIIDIHGRIILNLKNNVLTQQVNISNLPKGLYILRLQSDDGRVEEVGRFVKN